MNRNASQILSSPFRRSRRSDFAGALQRTNTMGIHLSDELGVKLIMVLGHSNCGAVKAAVKHINDQDPLPGAIDEMVKLIQPAVGRAKQRPGDIVENAIRENVLLGVERLKGLEPIIKEPVAAGHLKVVGATYDLASGRIRLVD